MAKPYSEMDDEPEARPGIIGQVPGPVAWSEYQGDVGPAESFDRRNVTDLPEAPDACGRFTGPR